MRYKKQRLISICNRFNGHNHSRDYLKAPSYGNYESTMHSKDKSLAMIECRNCESPHRSECRQYFARPTQSVESTKEQLKVYRQARHREYQAVVRPKATEAKVTTVEKVTNPSSNSQQTEPELIATRGSPVFVSTDYFIHLWTATHRVATPC